jgi:hypothetical protein
MIKYLGSKRLLLPWISSIATNRFKRFYTTCNQKPSEWREVLAAASPQGWPPPQHGAAARRRRAAAPQNTTDLHSKTLCIMLV